MITRIDPQISESVEPFDRSFEWFSMHSMSMRWSEGLKRSDEVVG